MTPTSSNSTLSLYPQQNAKLRLFALWYFAILMIAWNIAGHTFLGFEQAWIHPVAAVSSALLTQFLLEWFDARASRRKPRFAGSLATFVNYLPPAMISGFACAMLLYPNERVSPIVFASVLAIASKVLFRIPLGDGRFTHFLNPSNFGIAATLLLLPDVGQAPPYQFTENITGLWHWLLPALILVSGVFVHSLATGRLPLILAWLIAFVGQGIFRAWLGGTDWYVPLMPMSSAGFILFTLYMIPDPATTPIMTRRQIAFGASVALVYAALQLLHIVFGLFLALIIVCVVRGCSIYAAHHLLERLPTRKAVRTRQKSADVSTHAPAALAFNAGLNIVSNHALACTPPGNRPEIYQPRITFRDTNVVGNVYFLTYFRWSFEAFLQRLAMERSDTFAEFRSGSPRWLISSWTMRYLDPVGAIVGDRIEIRTDLQRHNHLLVVSSTIARPSGDDDAVIARSNIELTPQTELQPPSGPEDNAQLGYSYQPQWRSKLLDPLELLSWQGTCRERFLLEYASDSLRRVAERRLALQTTMAELRIHHALSDVHQPIRLSLRLKNIKCGQVEVQFDYITGEPGRPTLLATGFQTMSSKRFVGAQVLPCPMPLDILLALKHFTQAPRLLIKIDQIIDFSRSIDTEGLDDTSGVHPAIDMERALAK